MTERQHLYRHAQAAGAASRLTRVRSYLSLLERLPGLYGLTQRTRAVIEPAGWMTLNARPTRPRHGSNRTITVLTANLWHDWPFHRRQRERLERFARLVERQQVDVALLQEVARRRDLRVDDWLAQRLGMAYVYARANGGETGIGFEEGLAIFSRFPLAEPRLRQLGKFPNPFVRRLALQADVETPFGRLPVFSVHLGLLPGHNTAQAADLYTWVPGIAGERSAIIGGDFNTHENTPQILRAQHQWLDLFRQHNPRAEGVTYEVRGPLGASLSRRRLDYLFLQPGNRHWHVLESHHLQTPGQAHSDHQAVLARLWT